MENAPIKLPTLSYLLLDPNKPFIHRDLSWIQFNDRVMAEALSRTNPLLKRLRFLAISASNLDEFFMIRFASLLRSLGSAKAGADSKNNLERIYGTVLESARKFGLKQGRVLELLRREAAKKNIFLHLKSHDSPEVADRAVKIFREKILPHLITKNSFQYTNIISLQNLQSLVYINKELFLEVPLSLPQVFWEEAPAGVWHAFFLDDLILSQLPNTLPVKERPGIIRITRDADFTVDLIGGDTESIPDLIRKNIGSRDKGRLVRLQYSGNFPKDFLQEAADQLKLDLRQCFKAPGTLCLQGLFGFSTALPEETSRELNHPPLRSTVPKHYSEKNRDHLFDYLKTSDTFLHHPYDSFDAFLTWLQQACEDPNVIAIEQTIYRTDSVSKIVALLKNAASRKKIRVVLELRARFDEFNNLKVAEELSKAGVEVYFGFGSLKLHAKITLVSRREGEKIVHYTHLSTGNYNAKTARQYTDISIITGNEQIGLDARHFFDSIFKKEVPSHFRHLVTAPTKLHQRVCTLVRAETAAAKAGRSARIVAKVNALVDEKIIEDLYAASQAGVKVDLIVRGACSLIPGVKGLSENIRVISIVDRLLEHSRIYFFESSGRMYLSSADWMPRNFFSRLEIAFPVLDPKIYRFMSEVLIPGYFQDNVKARELTPRGKWTKIASSAPSHRAQWYFEELAASRYQDTPLVE